MMVISSFIIETQKDQVENVKFALSELPGIEIHSVVEEVKLIVTLETESIDESYQIGDRMTKLGGVISLCLIYTNFEDEVKKGPHVPT